MCEVENARLRIAHFDDCFSRDVDWYPRDVLAMVGIKCLLARVHIRREKESLTMLRSGRQPICTLDLKIAGTRPYIICHDTPLSLAPPSQIFTGNVLTVQINSGYRRCILLCPTLTTINASTEQNGSWLAPFVVHSVTAFGRWNYLLSPSFHFSSSILHTPIGSGRERCKLAHTCFGVSLVSSH